MDVADALRAPTSRSLAHSIVTPALVGSYVVVYLVLACSGEAWLTLDGNLVARLGSNYAPLTLGGEPWRLVSSTFIHLGLLHLALNTWALVTVGPAAERLYGSTRLALLYFAGGVGAGVASVWWNPDVNSAGSSGAIFGVLGALLASCFGRRAGVPDVEAAARPTMLVAIVATSLLFGAIVPGVDNAAHVGGLVTGFVGALLSARGRQL